jgi:phosphate transport system substrate-binding protein
MTEELRVQKFARQKTTVGLCVVAATVLLSSCSDWGASSGQIKIDGSSTVAPLITLVAEDFQIANPGTTVTVGTSGTGGGFEKFCAGETDMANASREIKDSERELCQKAGIDVIEIIVGNDALSLLVHPKNDWATCLTVEQVKTMWGPEAEGKVNNWNQIDSSFPARALRLFGAGTDSGTFDYFTKEINGEEGSSRTDYNPSEDDNVTISGVKGDLGAFGYAGFSYLEENRDKVKGIAVNGGAGCVEPSTKNVQNGTYTPLARPLHVYVNKAAAARPEVKAFFAFMQNNLDALTVEALFIPLNEEQKTEEAEKFAVSAGA